MKPLDFYLEYGAQLEEKLDKAVARIWGISAEEGSGYPNVSYGAWLPVGATQRRRITGGGDGVGQCLDSLGIGHLSALYNARRGEPPQSQPQNRNH